MFSKAILMSLCIFAFLVLGCPNEPTPPNGGVTGVKLTAKPTQALWNNKGEDTFQLAWEVTPADATNKSVVFTSSDPSVLTVSPSGLITGLGDGTATVTVKTATGGLTDTCVVRVKDKEVVVTSIVAEGLDWDTYEGNDGLYLVQDEFFFDREKNTFFMDPLVLMSGSASAEVPIGFFQVTLDKGYTASIVNDFGASFSKNGQTSDSFSGFFADTSAFNEVENTVKIRLTDPETNDATSFDVIFLYDKYPDQPVWIWENDKTGKDYSIIDYGTSQSGFMFFRKPFVDSVNLTFRAKKWLEKVTLDGVAYGNITDIKSYDVSAATQIHFTVADDTGSSSAAGDWEIGFKLQGANPLLKNLAINVNSFTVERFDFNSTITEYGRLALPTSTEIEVVAVPEDENASISITKNTETNTVQATPTDEGWKRTVSFDSIDTTSSIAIKVTVGESAAETCTYVVNLQEAATSVGGVNFEINVIDSIGGTLASKATKLRYKKSGTTDPETEVTIPALSSKTLNLDPNTLYDFEIVGDDDSTPVTACYAASRITNYFVDAGINQSLYMVQPKKVQSDRKAEAPTVIEFGTATIDKDTVSLNKVTTADFEINDNVKNLYVIVQSPSCVIEEMEDSSYGIYMSFGEVPNLAGANGIKGVEIESARVYDAVNGVTQTFIFSLGRVELPFGKSDIVIVGYDVAMNRVEHRVYANYSKIHDGDTLEFATFKNFTTASQRMTGTIGYYAVQRPSLSEDDFAMRPVDGKNSSYRVRVIFELVENNKPVPITGYEIYRRKAGEQAFKRVTRYVYPRPTARATHWTIDNDSSLVENEEYEYYVLAYNHSSSIKSPIIKGTVLDVFTYDLVAPSAHQSLTEAEAKAQSFVVKLSNPKLLTGYVDYVNLGVVILEKDGRPCFASNVNYYPNGYTPEIVEVNKIDDGSDDENFTQPSGPRFAIGFSQYDGELIDLHYYLHWYDQNHLENTSEDKRATVNMGRTVNDFIVVNTTKGTIEFTPNMFNDSFYADETNGDLEPFCPFNIDKDGKALGTPRQGHPFIPKKGTSYQWDVVQFGSSSRSTYDDLPIVCGRYLTNDDGSISTALTYGSNLFQSQYTATNGRLEFTVK